MSADGSYGEAEDVFPDPGVNQDDDFGLGSSLWNGDEGTLPEKQRDALVVLLKHEYISFDTHPLVTTACGLLRVTTTPRLPPPDRAYDGHALVGAG